MKQMSSDMKHIIHPHMNVKLYLNWSNFAKVISKNKVAYIFLRQGKVPVRCYFL